MMMSETMIHDLFRDVGGLGPARVVLRTCAGFMELFCDLAECRLAGGWLTVRRDEAHLHVPMAAVHSACLFEAGDQAHPHAPSFWLVGRCGKPSVIVILDVTDGAHRVRQEAAFRAVRARWGERIAFPQETGATPERVLH